jgi:hypothetical protein
LWTPYRAGPRSRDRFLLVRSADTGSYRGPPLIIVTHLHDLTGSEPELPASEEGAGQWPSRDTRAVTPCGSVPGSLPISGWSVSEAPWLPMSTVTQAGRASSLGGGRSVRVPGRVRGVSDPGSSGATGTVADTEVRLGLRVARRERDLRVNRDSRPGSLPRAVTVTVPGPPRLALACRLRVGLINRQKAQPQPEPCTA